MKMCVYICGPVELFGLMGWLLIVPCRASPRVETSAQARYVARARLAGSD
jgi:hypothetical protein